MNRPEARAMNLQFLHEMTLEHSRVRNAARDLYKLLHQWESDIKEALEQGDRERVSYLGRQIQENRPRARRLYAQHKEKERKLLSLWEQFHKRFPPMPEPSDFAKSLDAKREAYRETWFDPCYPDTDPDSITYICPECQSQSTSGYHVSPVCMNEFCTLEGHTMEYIEDYRAKLKRECELYESKDGQILIHEVCVPRSEALRAQQALYQERAKNARVQQEETLHNAQADLESLRRWKREGRLFKLLQQYRNGSITEPSPVAA